MGRAIDRFIRAVGDIDDSVDRIGGAADRNGRAIADLVRAIG